MSVNDNNDDEVSFSETGVQRLSSHPSTTDPARPPEQLLRATDRKRPASTGQDPLSRRRRFCALVVTRQPPEYVFPGEEFTVDLAAEGEEREEEASERHGNDSDTESPAEEVPAIHASLVVTSPTSSSSSLSTTNRPRLHVRQMPTLRTLSSVKRTATLRVEMGEGGVVPPRGCGVEIHFQAWCRERRLTCQTRVIRLVNAKLRFTPSETWTNPFYKDQGGKDRCLEGTISLDLNGHNNHDGGASFDFALETTLYYENPFEKVREQGILKQLGPLEALHFSDTNCTKKKLRYRIEEVSRRHMKYLFVVKLSAPEHAQGDVAPTFTPAVQVLSKLCSSKPSPAPTIPIDIPKMASALQVIKQWSSKVQAGLTNMQWRQIGYGTLPSGHPDHNHPHWQMQNPNEQISHLLSMYTMVQQNLGVLESAVLSWMADQPGHSPRLEPQHLSVQPPPPGYRDGQSQYGPLSSRSLPPPPPTQKEDSHRMQTPAHLPFQRSPPGLPDNYIAQNEPLHYGQAAARSLPSPSPTHLQFQRPPPGLPENYIHPGHNKHDYRPSVALTDEVQHAAMLHESLVEYVLAHEYRSSQTGDVLGFPAYSSKNEILGFYKMPTGGQQHCSFHAVDQCNFGESEQRTAQNIFYQEMSKHSRAVHSRSEAGSILTLMNKVLLYALESNSQWSTPSRRAHL